jgi:hypothetical protein
MRCKTSLAVLNLALAVASVMGVTVLSIGRGFSFDDAMVLS